MNSKKMFQGARAFPMMLLLSATLPLSVAMTGCDDGEDGEDDDSGGEDSTTTEPGETSTGGSTSGEATTDETTTGESTESGDATTGEDTTTGGTGSSGGDEPGTSTGEIEVDTGCEPGAWEVEVLDDLPLRVDTSVIASLATLCGVDDEHGVHVVFAGEEGVSHARRAPGEGWEVEVLDPSLEYAFTCELDDQGGVHVVHHDGPEISYSHRAPAGTWAHGVLETTSAELVDGLLPLRPDLHLTFDDTGAPHVFYAVSRTFVLDPTGLPTISPQGAVRHVPVSDPGSAEQVHTVDGGSVSLFSATASEDSLHLLYYDYAALEPVHASLATGATTWETTSLANIGSDQCEDPERCHPRVGRLDVDDDGDLHLAFWRLEAPEIIGYTRRPEDAQDWPEPETLIEGDVSMGVNSLAFDDDDGVHVAFYETLDATDGRVHHRYRADEDDPWIESTIWPDPVPAPPDGAGFSFASAPPQMRVDSSGRAHLLFMLNLHEVYAVCTPAAED